MNDYNLSGGHNESEKNERLLLVMISLGGIGLAVVSILMGWEFWVPPLLVIAAVFLWIMHITEQPSPGIRKVCYFLYAVLAVFYHGVHETSMFDISVAIVLVLAGFFFFEQHIYAEYFSGGIFYSFVHPDNSCNKPFHICFRQA